MNILVLNDCYQASIALILPFVAVELGLALAQVGALSSFQSAVGILMVMPAGLDEVIGNYYRHWPS